MTISQLIKSVSRKEWWTVLAVWFFVFGLTLAPFLFALSHLASGEKISGIHTLSPGDINVYLSYIRQVQDGHFLLNDLFTTETSQLPQFRLDWVLIGLLGKILSLSPLVTYHLARLLMSAALTVVFYLLVKYFFVSSRRSLLAYGFSLLATGAGVYFLAGLYNLIGYNPVLWTPADLWVSEGFLFLSTYHSPHLLFSWTLLLLVYLLILLVFAEKQNAKRKFYYSLTAGLATLALFLAHPFHILPVFVISGVYVLFLVFSRRLKIFDLWYLIIIYLLSSIGILYHLWYLANDWVINQKAVQNFTPTPYLPVVLIGYSLVLPLAFWQLWKLVKNGSWAEKKNLFLVVWLLGQTALIFLPFPWQRRMMQGWQVPLNFLALFWWLSVYNRFLRSGLSVRLAGWLIAALLLFLPTPIFTLSRDAYSYQRGQYNYYYSPDLSAAFEWISNNTSPSSRFLASMWVSNYLPGATGRYSYAGHQIETMFYPLKYEMTKRFYNSRLDNKNYWRRWLLREDIDYVFYSGYEKVLTDNFFAAEFGLVPVFENEEVVIYKLK